MGIGGWEGESDFVPVHSLLFSCPLNQQSVGCAQMGGIDEAALDNLALVTEMTKHIRVKAATSSSSAAQDLAQFSPAFVWLLRDFYLDLSEDGRQISPKEYLEIALQPSAASSPAIRAKNEVGADFHPSPSRPIRPHPSSLPTAADPFFYSCPVSGPRLLPARAPSE